jgi:hypothetical protein
VHPQTIYWVFRAVTYDLDRIRKHEINRPDLPHGRIESGKNYVAWLRIWGSRTRPRHPIVSRANYRRAAKGGA